MFVRVEKKSSDYCLVSRARRSWDLSSIALLYDDHNAFSHLVMITEIQ